MHEPLRIWWIIEVISPNWKLYCQNLYTCPQYSGGTQNSLSSKISYKLVINQKDGFLFFTRRQYLTASIQFSVKHNKIVKSLLQRVPHSILKLRNCHVTTFLSKSQELNKFTWHNFVLRCNEVKEVSFRGTCRLKLYFCSEDKRLLS